MFSALLCFLISLPLVSDTTITLTDIQVSAYAPSPFRWEAPASIGIVRKTEMELQSVSSLVPAVNAVSGVRMEERSPGSYRLSIRGSLVRSPYGVRNVKVYYNGFSLTDAGGNTYLNAININDLSGLEIIKGPDGSLYGANSGGVVFLHTHHYTNSLQVNGYGGSFGLAGNSFRLSRQAGNHQLTFNQSYQRADGYRQNTRHHRLFLQLSDRWQYYANNLLEFYGFYSDLAYRTPGGLTLEQYEENPRQARPATPTQPGSIEQKTSITQRMWFGGVRHRMEITPWLQHAVSVWGSHTDFIYPFITNYEIRDEGNVGMRTWFTLQAQTQTLSSSLELGYEGQRLVTDAWNYDNHAGEKGDIQAYNDIVNTQSFAFVRGKLSLNDRITLETGISINFNKYHFRDTTHIKNHFDPVWMPHISVNYHLYEGLAIRLTASKGYSTPTTAEVRPEDNRVHTNLQPEKGWNIEGGLRFRYPDGRLTADATLFHYLLHDGIISQKDSSGNSYFINSGKIRQIGFEGTFSWLIYSGEGGNSPVRQLRWNSHYTWSHFNYDRYETEVNDFTGNRVAGVPRTVWINNLRGNLPAGFYFFLQHNYTSRIFLNDGNTASANSYHLLSAQAGITLPVRKGKVRIYLLGDNLLNEKYSLGNDINANASRYYNPAPSINFQAGVTWEW